ncbi:MAG: 3'(2'),5'-bisphosphate nucleotidase CysQ [Nitrospira sp. CR1.3]|nr:3'(2'),5'-bisphosphate nucleotidase CysQ [Nitrospira sp. CR1.3]
MERELRLLVESVREAGARALELARSGFEVKTKKDRSPVTTADLEVDRILHEMQQTHFPEDGWLSEESPDDLGRLDRERVWIVDPIDGTRAFVNKLQEFCISAALVEKGAPLAAVIFNPSTGELFSAIRGQGLLVNGAPAAEPRSHECSPLVLANPRELQSGRWAVLDGTARCRPMHSIANALALVAAGRVQATITAEPENEWDIAAGVLLIQEAGGTITDADGNPFRFNRPKPVFRGVVAVAATTDRQMHRLLQAHVGKAAPQREPV